MDILVFTFTTLALGILCSVPGIVLGRLLVARRVVRELSAVWLVGGSVGSMFFLRLLLPLAPLGLLAVVLVVGMPIGIYKADLWAYLLKRRNPSDTK